MKKVLISILLILSVCVQAQNYFLYQTTLRNIDGTGISGQKVNVRFSILVDSHVIYAEINEAETDANGYFSLYIGKGTSEKGEFSKIDWSKGKYQVKTEINKGEGYTLAGTQELQSVPYAMQAEVTEGIQQKLPSGATWNVTIGDDGSLIPIPFGYSKLVFNDEFNGTGLPDSDKWNFEEGYVRNGEDQYYTVAREENCYQKDGNLNIICENTPLFIENAKVNKQWVDWKERRKDTTVTVKSASITTRNLEYWKYCRVDVRAKLPMCKGTWPAIWMMPQNDKHGWPTDGEMDIMEQVGYDPNIIHFTLHCFEQNSNHNSYHGSVSLPTAYEEFHVYSYEWKEKTIAWYIDGKKRYEIKCPDAPPGLTSDEEKDFYLRNWPYFTEFYLILNLAFGGGWGGQQGVDLNGLPQNYQIDYVRVYQ